MDNDETEDVFLGGLDIETWLMSVPPHTQNYFKSHILLIYTF